MVLRTLWAAALLLPALGGAAGCSSRATSGEDPAPVTVALARTTAGELSAALARLPDVRAEIVAEGGSSITSLLDLQRGHTDLTVPVADVAYLAYAGQLAEFPEPFSELRGMAVIGLNTLHLLVAPHAPIRSLADLRGRRVSLGAPGSSTALITERLLLAHGLTLDDIRSDRIPNNEIVAGLTGGGFDAAFSMFVPASTSVTAAVKAGVRLLHIEGPLVEDLRTRYPYLKRTLIPPGTYPGQQEPVRTIGADSVLVCRADLDDDLVRRLVEAYFATLPAMTPPDLDRAPATPVPLHPGAARYYRQRELSR